MEEGLATEHGGELLADALEELLDGGRVADEGAGHLEATGRDIADGNHDVAGDPLYEVAGVLVLDVEILLIDFLGRDTTSEHGQGCQVAAVTGVGGSHHVLVVEHLGEQLGNGQSTVDLGTAGRQWGKAGNEEVQTGEWHHVHGNLAQISIELTWEAEAACDTAHNERNQMVQIAIGGAGQLEGTEADVVQGLVINAENLVRVLDQLMHREGGVVRLNDGIRHLGRWHNGERAHHTVGVLFPDLGHEQSAHARASTTAEGVNELEALETITGLSLFTDSVQNGVNEFSALSVVTLGPVVAGARLAEDEVVGSEELTEGTSANGVHGSRFKIHKDRAGNVAAACGLVVVNIDALNLQFGVTTVFSGWINAMLIRDDLPELRSDLIAALAGLEVY